MKICKQVWGRGWEAGPFRWSLSSQGGVRGARVDPSWHRSGQLPVFFGSLTWLLPR